MKKYSVLLFLLAALTLAACGKKPAASSSGSTGGTEEPAAYGAGQSADALLDYAKRLEAAGNQEAADAVYALIDRAAAADGIYKGMKSAYEESPLTEVEELREIAEKLGGK